MCNVKMTRERALEIQAQQCAHYEAIAPGITEVVAAQTNADALLPGVEYSVIEINRYIPRGGKIEMIAGIFEQQGN